LAVAVSLRRPYAKWNKAQQDILDGDLARACKKMSFLVFFGEEYQFSAMWGVKAEYRSVVQLSYREMRPGKIDAEANSFARPQKP
jgi:hypothetical protein